MKKTLHASLPILKKVLHQKIPLSELLHTEPPPPPSVKALCFGVTRQFFRLNAILEKMIKKQPNMKEASMIALLMGLHQLLFSDKPKHAIVNETTNLMHRIKQSWYAGFVNGVLRRFLASQDEIIASLEDNPEYVYAHPNWLIERIKKEWPKHALAILQHNHAHPPMMLRVNLLKQSREIALKRLEKAGIHAMAHPFVKSAISLQRPCPIHELPGFTEGLLSVQDAAAQIAASFLKLEPHQRLLDACAAPGGKTCHLLETEPSLQCIAIDIDQKRLARVEQNLSRCDLKATLKAGDATAPHTFWDGNPFQRILLDAPCSATGVIRRQPDIRILRTAKDIQNITALQKKMLETLWPLLAKDGILIYVTCSIMAVENELQIRAFCDHNPQCKVIKGSLPWGHWTGHGHQILPGEAECDGFFYSILTKTE